MGARLLTYGGILLTFGGVIINYIFFGDNIDFHELRQMEMRGDVRGDLASISTSEREKGR